MLMSRFMLYFILFPLSFSCVNRPTEQPESTQAESVLYPGQVGDIVYDEKLDEASFKLCTAGSVRQYYSFNGMEYAGEKPAIVNFFKQHYRPEGQANENGYVTIRFIVNCQGKTGRFRMQEMDFNYQPKKFSEGLTKRLLALTKELDGWQPAQEDGRSHDYYYYLTFKVVNSQIQQILP